ncbi:unnamed protein product [Penicillium pancosmium]
MTQQYLAVVLIHEYENVGRITTKLPALLRTEGGIIWDVALDIFWDIHENEDYQMRELSFAERLSEVASIRSKDASLYPPILFSVPEEFGKSFSDSMLHSLMFCLADFTYNPISNYPVPKNELLKSLENALETLAWESSDSETILAYLEQKRRIRCDLLRYFQTILSKLPSWNYFFEDVTGYPASDGPELLREMCLDTVKFDEKVIISSSSIKSRIRQWIEWKDNLNAFRNSFESNSESDSGSDSELDLEWFQDFHRDVLRGTTYRANVESIETYIAEHFKPLLGAMASDYEEFLPTAAAIIKKLIAELENIQQDLPQKLKDFENCDTSEEKERTFLALKSRVSGCFELIRGVFKFFETVKAHFEPAGENSRIPEMIN